MTIRFAAARAWGRADLRMLSPRSVPLSASNDNALEVAAEHADYLVGALRHFARHGLSAAESAGNEAMRARDNGDQDSYAWWFNICRTLDRRVAGKLQLKAR